MYNIYVGIFIQGGLIDYVTTGVDKDTVIQEMIDIVNNFSEFEKFNEDRDEIAVFLNHECIWNYSNIGDC